MLRVSFLMFALSVALLAQEPAPPSPPTAAPNAPGVQIAAATGPVPDSKATVYIYRYKQFVGSGLEPSVYLDDQQLARMDNGRYFVVKVDPGTHAFRSNDKQAGVVLETKPANEYYIRVEIATGFMKGHGRVIHVTSEQGAYEIKKLELLGRDKVIQKDVVAMPKS